MSEQNPISHQFHPTPLGWLTENLTRFTQIKLEGEDNLTTAQQWLARGGSLIVYFLPHSWIFDPALITQYAINPYLYAINPYLNEEGARPMAWLTSIKFTGGLTGVKPFNRIERAGAQQFANRQHFLQLPIVQKYLITPENEAAAHQMNFRSIRHAIRILKAGGIVGASPEGTRGKTGGLLRANDGIELLLKCPRAAALPVVLSVGRFFNRYFSRFSPDSSVELRIGNLINYQQAESLTELYFWKDEQRGIFTVADALMMHAVDNTLPIREPGVDPYGEYSWKRIGIHWDRIVKPDSTPPVADLAGL